MAMWNGQRALALKKEASGKTFRFALHLEEETEVETNEYSYAELVKDALREQVNGLAAVWTFACLCACSLRPLESL